MAAKSLSDGLGSGLGEDWLHAGSASNAATAIASVNVRRFIDDFLQNALRRNCTRCPTQRRQNCRRDAWWTRLVCAEIRVSGLTDGEQAEQRDQRGGGEVVANIVD